MGLKHAKRGCVQGGFFSFFLVICFLESATYFSELSNTQLEGAATVFWVLLGEVRTYNTEGLIIYCLTYDYLWFLCKLHIR